MRSERALPGWAVALLALLPVAGAWCYKELIHPRPFWAYYYDPEMIYFEGGRALLQGHAPFNLDNPGMPVHAVAALVLAATGDAPQHVEAFLFLARLVSFAACVAALAWAVNSVFRECDWKLQVVAAWVYYLCSQSLDYLEVFSPEALFAAFGSIFVVCAWWCASQGLTVRSVLCTGFALGLCCALKLTFAPLAAVFVLAAMLTSGESGPAWRQTAAALAGIVIAFAIALIPAADGRDRLFVLVSNMLTHAGHYGEGEAGVPDPQVWLANAIQALQQARRWYVVLACIGALVAFDVWSTLRARRSVSRATVFVIVLAVAGIFATHVLLIRSFSLRYLLPAAFCGVLLWALAARTALVQRSQGLQWAILIAAGLLLSRQIELDATAHVLRIDGQKAARAQIEAELASLRLAPDAVIVYDFRAPVPSLALRMEVPDETFQREVDKLYPREGHFDAASAEVRLPQGAGSWDVALVAPDNLDEPAFAGAKPVAYVAGLAVLLGPRVR